MSKERMALIGVIAAALIAALATIIAALVPQIIEIQATRAAEVALTQTALNVTPSPVTSPSPTATSSTSPIDDLLRQLDAVWASQNWDEAINLIQQILAIDPSYPDMNNKLYSARVNNCYVLAGQLRIAEAEAEARQALAIKSNGVEAQMCLESLRTPTPIPPAATSTWTPVPPTHTQTPIPTEVRALFFKGTDGIYRPDLLASYEINDDVTGWTLTLREDVLMEDGSEFNANTVTNNFEFRQLVSNLAGNPLEIITEQVDDHTIIINFPSPVNPDSVFEGLSEIEFLTRK